MRRHVKVITLDLPASLVAATISAVATIVAACIGAGLLG